MSQTPMVRIGIDLGGTKIEGIALDGSTEIDRVRVATPRDDYEATLSAITSLVYRLADGNHDATVGIGIPGAIAPDTGLVKNANSTWLIGRPLHHDLEQRLGRPVRVANDANCFTVSEAADGAAGGAGVVFGVILGTGVGGGVVVDGRLLVGPNAIAGEWGHNPLPWPDADESPGPRCYCGLQGCVETFLSGPGLEADYRQVRDQGRADGARFERFRPGGEVARPKGVVEIVAMAAAGDPAATLTMQRYERRLARGLSAVIHVLDPDVVVLGGGLSNIERLYERVPEIWAEFVFGARAQVGGNSVTAGRASVVRTRLVRAKHGDSSGVRGAAWLWT